MFKRDKKKYSDAKLDQLGRELLRTPQATEDALEEIISSPFLYTRIRARIAREKENLEERESWYIFSGVAKRALLAMGLVAALTFGMLWFDVVNRSPVMVRQSTDELIFESDMPGIDHIVFAENSSLISSDEVLATVVSDEEEEEIK
jgi:hypothetical protein